MKTPRDRPKLRQVDELLSRDGDDVLTLAKQFGGLKSDQVKRVKVLTLRAAVFVVRLPI